MIMICVHDSCHGTSSVCQISNFKIGHIKAIISDSVCKHVSVTAVACSKHKIWVQLLTRSRAGWHVYDYYKGIGSCMLNGENTRFAAWG